MSKKNKRGNHPISQKSNPHDLPTIHKFAFNSTYVYALLVAVLIVSFLPAIYNDFLYWDDNMYVTENEWIKKPSFGSLLTILRAEFALNYHPVTMFSLWLTSLLFGSDTATPFIIGNIIIHILNTLLIYKLTLKLSNSQIFTSFFVAAIWSIHPMHVESVVWVSERKDVLYTFFFLLATLNYCEFIEKNNKKYFSYVIVFFLFACLSKAMAVVLPLVLLLIDFWYGKGFITKENIKSKTLLFVIALFFGVLAIHVQAGGLLNGLLIKTSISAAINNSRPFDQRILLGFWSMLVYLFKFIFPFKLRNFYTYPSDSTVYDFQYLIAPLIGLAILGVSYIKRNTNKTAFFGLLFFFFSIVTVLQFISVGAAMLAERYTYLSYFGIAFFGVMSLNHYIKNPKTNIAILSIFGFFLMYQTYIYVQTYRSTNSLFINAYKYEPHSRTVNLNLAISYDRMGYTPADSSIQRADKVLKYGQVALQKGANSLDLYLALGNASFIKGDKNQALKYFNYCFNKAHKTLKANLAYKKALIYYSMNDFGNANVEFTNAISNSKDTVLYLPHRAYTNYLSKNFKNAIEDYTWLIKNKVQIDSSYNHRAVSRFSIGDINGAIDDLKSALRYNPNYTEAKNNLSALGIKN